MRRYAVLWVSAAMVLAACATPKPPPPSAEIWPTHAWLTSTPEAQGIDSAVLANAVETLKARNIPIHSLLVERNGYVVMDAYFFPFENNEPHDVASITKSVTSMLIGIAMDDHGSITPSTPIATVLPEPVFADPRKAQITLAELLSMTSGLDCSADQGRSLLAQMETSPHWADYAMSRPLAADPGSRFEYCAGNMQLISTTISRVAGESAFMLARDRLFAPLGITDVAWPADPDGVSRGFADLRLEPRDLAKLGYLWLHNGHWEDKQVVPAAYLKDALAPHANVQAGIQYGYGMWLYPGHTPYDFEANGRGGQRITVLPDLNAVVVVTGGGMDANEVTPLISAAFKSANALPANNAGDAQLASALSQVAAAPVTTASLQSPLIAHALADRAWFLPPNPLGVQSLTLSFPSATEAAVRLAYANGAAEDDPIGMDGAPRLSTSVTTGLPVAVGGQWTSAGFALDYDEVARINAYRLVITPAPGGISVHLTERSGLANQTMLATDQPPAQRVAGISTGQR